MHLSPIAINCRYDQSKTLDAISIILFDPYFRSIMAWGNTSIFILKNWWRSLFHRLPLEEEQKSFQLQRKRQSFKTINAKNVSNYLHIYSWSEDFDFEDFWSSAWKYRHSLNDGNNIRCLQDLQWPISPDKFQECTSQHRLDQLWIIKISLLLMSRFRHVIRSWLS